MTGVSLELAGQSVQLKWQAPVSFGKVFESGGKVEEDRGHQPLASVHIYTVTHKHLQNLHTNTCSHIQVRNTDNTLFQSQTNYCIWKLLEYETSLPLKRTTMAIGLSSLRNLEHLPIYSPYPEPLQAPWNMSRRFSLKSNWGVFVLETVTIESSR